MTQTSDNDPSVDHNKSIGGASAPDAAATRHQWGTTSVPPGAAPAAQPAQHDFVTVSPQHFVNALTNMTPGSQVSGAAGQHFFDPNAPHQGYGYSAAMSVPVHYAAAAPYAPETARFPAAPTMIKPLSHRDGALGLMLGLMVLAFPISGAVAMATMNKAKAPATTPVATTPYIAPVVAAPLEPSPVAPFDPSLAAPVDPAADAAKAAADKAALALDRAQRKAVRQGNTAAARKAAAQADYQRRLDAYNKQKAAWAAAHPATTAASGSTGSANAGTTAGGSAAAGATGGGGSGQAATPIAPAPTATAPTPTPAPAATTTAAS